MAVIHKQRNQRFKWIFAYYCFFNISFITLCDISIFLESEIPCSSYYFFSNICFHTIIKTIQQSYLLYFNPCKVLNIFRTLNIIKLKVTIVVSITVSHYFYNELSPSLSLDFVLLLLLWFCLLFQSIICM